jgi:MFS family permease
MVIFQFGSAMPLFMVRELGLPESLYGAMFLVNTVLIIFIEVPLNLATTDWPHHRVLALGALLTGLGFGGLALVTGATGVAATIVVWTFGEMILMPGSAAYVADISPPQSRGRYMGADHVTFSIAFVLGPWLGVLLLDRFGGAAVWTCALCAGCLSSAMLWRVTAEPREDP